MSVLCTVSFPFTFMYVKIVVLVVCCVRNVRFSSLVIQHGVITKPSLPFSSLHLVVNYDNDLFSSLQLNLNAVNFAFTLIEQWLEDILINNICT